MRAKPRNLYNGMTVGPANTLWIAHEIPAGLSTVPVSDAVHMLARDTLTDAQVAACARHHPHGIRYRASALCRAAAFGIEHPEMVVLGFGALALYGLPFFADGTDTVLMDPSCRQHQPAGPRRPAIVRRGCEPRQAWDLTHAGMPLRAAAPAAALVQALKLVHANQVAWPVIQLDGYDARTIRGIQLLDSARRFLGVDLSEVLRCAEQVLSVRWISHVIARSSHLADSPRETEMRLMLGSVADKHGVTLHCQVPVRKDDKIITTWDFAIIEARIGIMYDGGHHGDPKQWESDSAITLALTSMNWCPLRFTRQTYHTAPGLVDEKLRRWRG